MKTGTMIDTNKLVKKTYAFVAKYGKYVTIAIALLFTLLAVIDPVYADNYQSKVKSVLTDMVDIIGFVFKAVGIVLGVYSVGQLVLAFKNEDADSKSRASTQLVVAIVLIAMPSIIESLDLVNEL